MSDLTEHWKAAAKGMELMQTENERLQARVAKLEAENKQLRNDILELMDSNVDCDERNPAEGNNELPPPMTTIKELKKTYDYECGCSEGAELVCANITCPRNCFVWCTKRSR